MKKIFSFGLLGNVLNKTTLTNVQDVQLVEVKESKYSKEVLEIHNEFACAADRLLEEANIILKEAEKANVDKVTRLEKLGFKQSSQVVETKPLLDKANLSKEQLELLAYYKRNYPLNKFITEEQVKYICHKYNLVCGDVSRFKGFVPEKNLKQIEKFKINDKDYLKLFASKVTYSSEITPLGSIEFDGGEAARRYPSIRELVEIPVPLQICAPVKDMDINGLELEDGYKLVKKHIPDPVVLQPVKGGYLILTAWGDEASDPVVVNESMN